MSVRAIKIEQFSDDFKNQYDNLLNSAIIKHKLNLSALWIKEYINNYLRTKELFIIAVYQDNILIGCLPMYIEETRATRFWNYKVLKIIGNGPTDFFDIIVKEGFEKIVNEKIVNYLSRDKSWDKFELTELPEDSVSFPLLIDELKRKELNHRIDYPNGYYFINTSNENWEKYELDFNLKNKDLLKSERRIISDNIELHTETFFENIYSKLIDSIDLYEQRRKTLNQKNTYQTQERNLFLKSVIAEKEKRKSVEFTQLIDKDGTLWAFQLDWIDNNIRYHWNHAYNESYKRYSPGKILLKEIMKSSFKNSEIIECNYMRGLSDYKSKLVNQKSMLVRITMENPNSIKIKATRQISRLLKLLRK